jgi:hypothetical protein
MKVIDPGHTYRVENTDGSGTQVIQFVLRRGYDGELLPEDQRKEGIQSQELLRVLIDRTIYLHTENPWSENVKVVQHLRDALRLYEARAARAAIVKLQMPERRDFCKQCGHFLCFCNKENNGTTTRT